MSKTENIFLLLGKFVWFVYFDQEHNWLILFKSRTSKNQLNQAESNVFLIKWQLLSPFIMWAVALGNFSLFLQII